ncbi:Peptidase M48, Ste24p [Nitrosococcus oceani ATCC 19707]|uniref:Peptidase M48, Ste24p n=2 Tax=Nitrosococcus oceani TaxID=1229 RepID=Q3JA47_NITOC|nr:M48 family metallopeptidase [Nitrosococcus oceani]ABA58299.1 Peptidase M48, Ste24p [Nitrosococcus oceani ATCC 19707]EDZ67171.1 peptidase, M48 family [Nitrosococcus oceani AFC27]KFI19229.1 peptidase M48 [Nitrosococcus oceani C-27]GEM18683.1 peptidase M48 [Nitrosococcus oceani]
MDFFQAQNDARRNTNRFVLLFIVAVMVLVLLTNFLVMAFMGAFSAYFGNDLVMGRYADSLLASGGNSADILSWAFWKAFLRVFDWQMFFGVGFIVTAIVAAASFYKIMALSSGGKVVAEMLGGRLIRPNTELPSERRVLNIVEEMAIASGTPVPLVYVLPEAGINAFAAGFTPGDAVIGVTEGSIRHLNRDQLQGVIAHEFSHILNGDIRLNIRLMGLLHGILIISIIGSYLLRYRSSSRRRRSDSTAATVVLGLGLVAIGSVGSFFGSLIKASVSRQREYLADASAVQFTRNPDGIADALRKIGGFAEGSTLESPSAAEVSHAFFANGVRSMLASFLATHPPLGDRIRRIQPHWNGEFLEAGRQADEIISTETPEPVANQSFPFQGAISPAVADIAFAMNNVGRPQQQHLEYAHALIDQVPNELIEAVREPYGARALIHALVINKDSEVRKSQLEHLEKQGDQGVHELTARLLTLVDALGNQFRLPLIEISIASMRQLSPSQYQLFKKNLSVLIEADNKISIFQWALQKIVFHNLDSGFNKPSVFSVTGKYSALSQLENEIGILLSLLVHAEHDNYKDAEKAFNAAKRQLDNIHIKLLQSSIINLNELDTAIDRLALLKPLLKPRVLKACAASITVNNHVSVIEAELLRAFSAAIDCPMPLLLNPLNKG